MTYPDEVEGIIRIPIEVEPLDETPLEDLGLNTLDLGEERGLEPPIKPPSLDSFRMKEVDHLTNHTPPSPHVASFHHKDMYCYYHPCIGDLKKHYGFKPGLLGQGGSLGVDLSNLKMIEDDWKLEPKEISFLGRKLNLPVRPKELENVRIKETHHSEHIIQQPIFQHVTPSHNNGRKSYLLEDKQISNVGVFDEVFSTWMTFGGNTRDLGSFGEETDEITNLHQILEEVLCNIPYFQ
ncbi:hypothetical protein Tco_0894143, partial [Tanacetum coccineum]